MKLAALTNRTSRKYFVSGHLVIVRKDGRILRTAAITRKSLMRKFSLDDEDVDEFAVEYEKYMESNVIPSWRREEYVDFRIGTNLVKISMKDVDHIDVFFKYE